MDELIQMLNSTEEAERIYAVYDIAELDNPAQYITALIDRLKIEEVQAVRNALTDALKSLKTQEHFDLLFELFSSDDAYLRNCAIEIFATKGEDAVAYLTSKLDHTNQDVRKLIIDSLVEIKTDESIMAIRAALHDLAINVRITAAEYLGKLADKSSIDELVEAFINEQEPMMRSAILNALIEINEPSAFKKITDIVSPCSQSDEDMIYMPELLRFTAHFGSKDDILKTLRCLKYNPFYSSDIAEFLVEVLRKHPELMDESKVKLLIEQLQRDGQWEGN